MAVGRYPVIAAIILVVIFGQSKYVSADTTPAEIVACDSNCQSIGKEYIESIAWDKNPCNDFYEYTCGNELSNRGAQQRYKKQENYVKDFLDKSVGDIASPDHFLSSDWNDSVLRLMQRYYNTCSAVEPAGETDVKPIIELLMQTSSMKSWLELENWSVSQGFNSTFFSVKVETRVPNIRNKIILGPPNTTCYETDHMTKCQYVIQRLTKEGLSSSFQQKLQMGCMQEHELYDVMNNQDVFKRPGSKEGEESKTKPMDPPKRYNIYNLMIADAWDTLWNKHRTNEIWFLQRYLKNYWKRSIESPATPSLHEYEFDGYIEFPELVTAFGTAAEKLEDETMQNIILWRMVTQLVQYHVQGGREILVPTACRMLGTDYEQQKNIWYRVFLQSLNKPIKKLFRSIDLSTKLWIYKNLHKKHKILPENEPLTPRQFRRLNRLEQELETLKRDVIRVNNNVEGDQTLIKFINHLGYCKWYWKLICGIMFDDKCAKMCEHMDTLYHKKPKIEGRMATLKLVLDVKKKQCDRTSARLKNYKKRHEASIRNYISMNDTKPEWVRNYVEEKRLPKFPFESAQPIFAPLIIEKLSTDSNHVDLTLSLNRLLRGMQLQLHDTDEFHYVNINVTNDAFIPLLSLFKNNKFQSFNYGVVGSEIATKSIQKISTLAIDRDTELAMKSKEITFEGSATPSVGTMKFGVQVAWDAYDRLTRERNWQGMTLAETVDDEDSPEMDDGQIFFVTYVNANCGARREIVNEMMYQFPNFCNMFSCGENSKCYNSMS